MFWRVDPLIEEARKLAEWSAFHKLCGQHNLSFDELERTRRNGPYQCRAMGVRKTDQGGWQFIDRGLATGRTVIDAVAAAYKQSGITVPGAEEMLARGLTGKTIAVEDDFDDLLGDDFEGLLG